MTRTLYFIFGSLCLVLGVIVGLELNSTRTDFGVSPSVAGTSTLPARDDPKNHPNIDQLADDVLEHPLFTAGRNPPESAVAQETVEEEPQSAPQLIARLAGIVIGPKDVREALFIEGTEMPRSFKQGDVVDGWAVTSIEPDRVVLTSAFGERVLQPSFGDKGKSPSPPKVVKQKPGPIASGAQLGGLSAVQPFTPTTNGMRGSPVVSAKRQSSER